MNVSAAEKGDVSNPGQGPALFPSGQLVPFIVVTALFFLWAIPNNLNDVLIRQFSQRVKNKADSRQVKPGGWRRLAICWRWFAVGNFACWSRSDATRTERGVALPVGE